jgi:hypothetical protein
MVWHIELATNLGHVCLPVLKKSLGCQFQQNVEHVPKAGYTSVLNAIF